MVRQAALNSIYVKLQETRDRIKEIINTFKTDTESQPNTVNTSILKVPNRREDRTQGDVGVTALSEVTTLGMDQC